jgi:hypothetical protein
MPGTSNGMPLRVFFLTTHVFLLRRNSLTAPSGELIPMVKDNGGSYRLIQKLQ